MPPVALTIAGSDPSGGAGIQADLKTFHEFGVYGEAVVTLLTAQNTRRVSLVEVLPPELISQQIEAVITDIPPTAAKTGALGDIKVVELMAELARSFPFPLIVDPVMVSKHGTRLLSKEAEQALKKKLLPLAYLIMPNIPEAEALTGMVIRNEDDMRQAAERLREMGCKASLIKGGHRAGQADDVLAGPNGTIVLSGKRVDTLHTHGTGCTYSAAITANIALGIPLNEAVAFAKSYIQSAIETAPGLGAGRGPVNHFALNRAKKRIPPSSAV